MPAINENTGADPGAETAIGPPAAEETELIAPTEAAGVWSEGGAAGPICEARLGLPLRAMPSLTRL